MEPEEVMRELLDKDASYSKIMKHIECKGIKVKKYGEFDNKQKWYIRIVGAMNFGRLNTHIRQNSFSKYICSLKWYGKFYDGLNEESMTLEQCYERIPSATNGSVDEFFIVSFDTEKELDNFIAYTDTNLFKYAFVKTYRNMALRLDVLPYMNDYTRPWTDEDLKEYFGITDEEWENEVMKTMNEIKQTNALR